MRLWGVWNVSAIVVIVIDFCMSDWRQCRSVRLLSVCWRRTKPPYVLFLCIPNRYVFVIVVVWIDIVRYPFFVVFMKCMRKNCVYQSLNCWGCIVKLSLRDKRKINLGSCNGLFSNQATRHCMCPCWSTNLLPFGFTPNTQPLTTYQLASMYRI